MKRKFEDPYKALLDAGVKFYASLGNHDDRAPEPCTSCSTWRDGRTTRSRRPSRTSASSRSRATTSMPEQIAWLEKELDSSGEGWKIPYFHHPLYSSGDAARLASGPARRSLEPLFLERRRHASCSPVTTISTSASSRRKGSCYFVAGSGGQAAAGRHRSKDRPDRRRHSIPTRRFSRPRSTAISCSSTRSRAPAAIIDSGVIERRKQP